MGCDADQGLSAFFSISVPFVPGGAKHWPGSLPVSSGSQLKFYTGMPDILKDVVSVFLLLLEQCSKCVVIYSGCIMIVL